jgi:membrane protease YdiL (CAAX protease family)
MMSNIVLSIVESIIFECLPVGLILIFLAIYRKSIKPFYAMIFLCAAVSVSTVMLFLPRVFFFSDLSWNWQGKLLNFVWPWVVVYGFAWLTPEEVGLTLPVKTSNFRLAIQWGIIFALSGVLISSILGVTTTEHFHLESTLFQFTMPGLAEEITSRGIFLAILNRYLGKQWKIGDTRFGWGIILITIMFVIEHLYHYNIKTHELVWAISSYYTDYINISMVILAGILLGIIREKSGSIWPGVILHNIMNGLSMAIEQMFFARG